MHSTRLHIVAYNGSKICGCCLYIQHKNKLRIIFENQNDALNFFSFAKPASHQFNFGILLFAGQPTGNTGYIDAKLACILTTTFRGHKEMKGSIAGITKHDDSTKGTDVSFTEPYSLFLCTGMFTVSPEGFEVSASLRGAPAAGCLIPLGRK